MKDTEIPDFLKNSKFKMPHGVKNFDDREVRLVGDFEEDPSEFPDLRNLAKEQGAEDSLPSAFECDAKACLKERDEYLAMSGLPTGNDRIIDFVNKRVNSIKNKIADIQRMQKEVEEAKELVIDLLTEMDYEEIQWVKEQKEDGYVYATKNHNTHCFGRSF